jgi:RNA polymerase sigma-70 factor (ECF subfamily)
VNTEDISLKEAKLIQRLSRIFQPAKWETPLSDPQIFSDIYDQSHLSIFRYIYGLWGGPQEDIEDLTAETFKHAWEARRSFHGKQQEAIYWLLKIAHHIVIDAYRRNQARIQPQETLQEETIPDEMSSKKSTPESLLIADEQAAALLKMLQNIPEDQREMLVLRYLLNWRVRQIGKYLGIPENTVSVTIRRTLERLQREWPGEKE